MANGKYNLISVRFDKISLIAQSFGADSRTASVWNFWEFFLGIPWNFSSVWKRLTPLGTMGTYVIEGLLNVAVMFGGFRGALKLAPMGQRDA